MKTLLAFIIICSTGMLAAGCSNGSCGMGNSWGNSYARPYASNYSSCPSGNCGGFYYARPVTYQAPCTTCQKSFCDDTTCNAPSDNSQVNKPVAPADDSQVINKPVAPADQTKMMNEPVAPPTTLPVPPTTCAQ